MHASEPTPPHPTASSPALQVSPVDLPLQNDAVEVAVLPSVLLTSRSAETTNQGDLALVVIEEARRQREEESSMIYCAVGVFYFVSERRSVRAICTCAECFPHVPWLPNYSSNFRALSSKIVIADLSE